MVFLRGRGWKVLAFLEWKRWLANERRFYDWFDSLTGDGGFSWSFEGRSDCCPWGWLGKIDRKSI